jgi:hypothetical protein
MNVGRGCRPTLFQLQTSPHESDSMLILVRMALCNMLRILGRELRRNAKTAWGVVGAFPIGAQRRRMRLFRRFEGGSPSWIGEAFAIQAHSAPPLGIQHDPWNDDSKRASAWSAARNSQEQRRAICFRVRQE